MIKAHDGPVEGIATVYSKITPASPITFITLGNDARVKLWRVDRQSEGGCSLSAETNLMDFRVSLLPDVSGLRACRQTDQVVSGCLSA